MGCPSGTHRRLVQCRSPRRNGLCHQPTNTTPVSPGDQKACRVVGSEQLSLPLTPKTSLSWFPRAPCRDLARGEVLWDALQHRDVAALDVQDTEDRHAAGGQCLPPVLVVHELLTLWHNPISPMATPAGPTGSGRGDHTLRGTSSFLGCPVSSSEVLSSRVLLWKKDSALGRFFSAT